MNLDEYPDYYLTILSFGRELLKVKGSKFIASSREVSTEEEARNFVHRISAEFHDATHHCFAYRVGVGPKATVGYSDAGEPSGTAGRPIFGAIEARGVTNVVVVVTRYFGGTKLGTGGLAKAYHQAALNVLDAVGTVERQITHQIKLTFPYTHVNLVKHVISKYEGTVARKEYTERVSMVIRLRRSLVNEFRRTMEERSGQNVEITDE